MTDKSGPRRYVFKNTVWTSRPMTVRNDGWRGIPNLFNRLFRRHLDMCYKADVPCGSLTIAPGETVELMFPIPDELQP